MELFTYLDDEGPTVGDSVECVNPADGSSLRYKHVYTVSQLDRHFVYLAELGQLNGYYPSRFRLLSRAADRAAQNIG